MKLGSLLIVLIIIIAVSAYTLPNWQKYGSLFGKRGYENVALANLLSFAAVYDGKNICTKGYVIEGNGTTFIKSETSGSRFDGSAWIVNKANPNFIFNTSNTVTKAVMARVCGNFVTKRDGEFGNPPFWRHQLTINEFSALGNSFPVNY